MKQELKKHLLPLAVIFVITTIFWIFAKSPWYNFIFLFLGLALGSFFLDLDHVVYWYYLNPSQEESKLARIAISKKDYRAALKLLEFTHKSHTSLIFHHYLFQIILAIVSILPLVLLLIFSVNHFFSPSTFIFLPTKLMTIITTPIIFKIGFLPEPPNNYPPVISSII